MATTNGGTPSSAPSLAALSDDSLDVSDISKRLFDAPEDEEDALRWSANGGLGSKIEMTDLRVRPSSPSAFVRDGVDVDSLMCTSIDDDSPHPESVPSQDGVPHIEASCHSGLNLSPQQLADIFSIFEGVQTRWPFKESHRDSESSPPPMSRPPSEHIALDKASEDDDAATTVTSNTSPSIADSSPRLHSLERECAALKDIVKGDSVNILKLKSDLDAQRATSIRNANETALLKMELDMTRRERDIQNERDAQHLETIAALKNEIDGMLTQKYSTVVSANDVEQMQVENELFASQIIDNEIEMRTIQATLNALETENKEMMEELHILRARMGQKPQQLDEEWSPSSDLVKHVMNLTARIKSIEAERSKTDPPTCLDDRDAEKGNLFTEHTASIDGRDETNTAGLLQEVEVTIDGPLEPNNSGALVKNQRARTIVKVKKRGGFWSWCGCVPTLFNV